MVDRGDRHALEQVLYWIYMHFFPSLKHSNSPWPVGPRRLPLSCQSEFATCIVWFWWVPVVLSLAELALADLALESLPRNPQSLLMHLLKVPSSHNSLANRSQQPPAAPSNAAVQAGWLITILSARKKHKETFWTENYSLQRLKMEIPWHFVYNHKHTSSSHLWVPVQYVLTVFTMPWGLPATSRLVFKEPFYRWAEWDSERLIDLSKVTQLESRGDELWTELLSCPISHGSIPLLASLLVTQ